MQLRPVILRTSLFASALGMLVMGPACKDVTCGSGTIEKNGACAPASETVGTATCGPFTMLQGDKCVPMFDPTQCDPMTTSPEVDPATGVTTCVGMGGGGSCTSPFACPAPTGGGKQTICGQIYDLQTDQPFQAAGATGTKCTATTADGPCALGIKAFDAIAFANNPGGATPLTIGSVYIDDCGRYRVVDVAQPSGPYVGLGFDDASAGLAGPAGVTNAVGVAVQYENVATKDFDGFVAAKSTTDMWTSTGGPTLAQGMFVNIFRAHKIGHMEQAGVTFTRSGNPVPNDDFYFKSTDTGRTMIDPAATATGANGTAIVINAHISDGGVNSGIGGLPSQCIWETHPGSSIPNVVFVQVKRPRDNFMGDVCDL